MFDVSVFSPPYSGYHYDLYLFHLGHFLLEAVSELLAQLFDPALVARRHHTPRLTLMFRMMMLMRMRMILMIFTLAACCSEMSPTGFDAFRSRSKSALLSVDIYHFQHHHHVCTISITII